MTTNTFQDYLNQIGKFPLLTHEQEILYGKQIQLMLKHIASKQNLQQGLGRVPTDLEWAQAEKVTVVELQQVVAIGARAKDLFLRSNLRLVVSIAKKYKVQTNHLQLLDLIQEGNIGLSKAIDKFDPTKGYRFSTYAYWWIRQAISRSISEYGREIRLPIHICEKSNKSRRAYHQLFKELGRKPTIAEVAKACNLRAEKVSEIFAWMQQPVSLDIKFGEHDDLNPLNLFESKQIDPEDYVDRELLEEYVAQVMNILTPAEQSIIAMRYGLNEREPMSLGEAGEVVHLSREGVRQIQVRILNKMRKATAQNPIDL
jgi:RNA polymerase nonessential primary-like sigma factor